MENKTETALRKALLEDGELSYDLYEFEMEYFVDDWYDEMDYDKDDYIFVIDESEGDVAIVLITKEEELLINEEARDRLKLLWSDNYVKNLNDFMPFFLERLSVGVFPIIGLNLINTDSGEVKKAK
jgi:hypothetical protein